jgi:hypothetical protein
MLQKLKITTCVLFLCLFGLTLAAVSNVSAREGDSEAILACAQIKTKVGKDKVWKLLKEKKNCFADLARALNPAVDQLNAELSSLGAAHEKSIKELQAQATMRKMDMRGEMQALVDKALEDLFVTQAALDKAEAEKVELQAFVDKAQASRVILQTEVDYEKKYNDVKDFINWSAWRHCNAGDGPCKPPFS